MTDMNERRSLALAGLVHDVGKFALRAGVPLEEYADFGRDEVGAHGAHAKWSAQFVSSYVPSQWREGLHCVLYHHQPVDRRARIVALADRLSASERQAAAGEEPQQLLSIFCQLGDGVEQEQYLPLRRLAIKEEALFPGSARAQEDVQSAYRQLWQGFVKDVRAIKADDLETYLRGIQLALQSYTWCMPSAYYRSQPDVSLYDHCRTTAALAACLSEAADDVVVDLLSRRPTDEARRLALFTLVSGDLSGVQDFLYTLASSGAAKSLRGRSFYLQMLTEAAGRYVLRRLNLPLVNLIYVGGGHFYLLAPAGVGQTLRDVASEVSRALLRQHGPALYLALAGEELCAEDFEPQHFSRAWMRVGRRVSEAKHRRYSELGPEELERAVFAPQGTGGDASVECSICHAEENAADIEADPEDPEVRRCRLCASLEKVARGLADATHLVLLDVEPVTPERGDWRRVPLALGMDVALWDARAHRMVLSPERDPERAEVLSMCPSTDEEAPTDITQRLSCALVFGDRPLVNVTPRVSERDVRDWEATAGNRAESQHKPRKGEIKEFGLMQSQSRGVPRLGALRMDVDDLGSLFARGFGSGQEAHATLSRVASLSASLQRFFEGWVGDLCRQANRDEGTDLTYAIYSGGDDLFIVGAWHVLPGLAYAIRRDLGRYACGNEMVTVSAGLTLHGGKFPLVQMAHRAGEALDGGAKQFSRKNGADKDAIQFLGQVFGWEHYQEADKRHQELMALADEVGRSLLQVLLRLYRASVQGRRRNLLNEDQLYWGPWVWRSAYYLARHAGRSKRHAERILAVGEWLSEENYRGVERVALAARWAELETRSRAR